jgi:hypothetical protein
MTSTLYASYAGGVNAVSDSPRLIGEQQLKMLVNGTVRNGFIAPRPALKFQRLKWRDTRSQVLWKTGINQGMAFYDSPEGPALVFAFDGEIQFLSLQTMEIRRLVVAEDDPAKSHFSKDREFVYFCQRGKYMVNQDGTSRPLILEGTRPFYQPVQSGKFLAGTIMAEGWGRVALASHDRKRIYFSDHELDPLGNLSFVEGSAYYPNARYFQVPEALGRLVALRFSPSLNGTKRFGPLLAFCERGIMAYDVSIDRSSWLTSDIAAMMHPDLGACSHRAVTSRGANVIFSDHNGRIQSLSGAISEAQDNTLEPIDSNVWPAYRGKSDLRFRTAVTFDDRTLTTVLPERVKRSDGRLQVRHRAMVVYQHDPAQPISPVWDGLWDGIKPVTMTAGTFEGAEFCYILAHDENGHSLYQLTKEPGDDQMAAGPKKVTMTAALRPTDADAPFQLKPFKSGAIRLSGIRGKVDIQAWQKLDRQEVQSWFSHNEDSPACMDLGCVLKPQPLGIKTRIGLPALATDCREVGMIFSVTGQATIEEVGIDFGEPKSVSAQPDTACSNSTPKCPPNLFTH